MGHTYLHSPKRDWRQRKAIGAHGKKVGKRGGEGGADEDKTIERRAGEREGER